MHLAPLGSRGLKGARAAFLHLLGGALGGGLVGAMFGVIGAAVAAQRYRVPLLVVGILAALLVSSRWRLRRSGFGLRYQVPRQWARNGMPLGRLLLLWGLLLGSGLATVIPQSSLILLIAVEVSAGPAFAAMLGALYGVARVSMHLILALKAPPPERAMTIVPRLQVPAAAANIAVVLVGGTALALIATTS